MDALRQSVCSNCPSTELSVPFPPHVTLLAGLTKDKGWNAEGAWKALIDLLKEMGQDGKEKLSPIVVDLKEITTRELYFQCILIAVKLQTDLARLNGEMRVKFSEEEQSPYYPHCSLLYGHLSSMQIEDEIQAMEARNAFIALNDEGRLAFGRQNLQTMTLGAIELWDTHGSVKDWRLVNRVSL